MSKTYPSTFLINSSMNNSFGTGFCVHQDEKGSFLVTCAHVVNACGVDNLKVNDYSTTVIANSTDDEVIDLAVVYVEGLIESEILQLTDSIYTKSDTFRIEGFRPHKNGEYRKEPLEGFVKKISEIFSTFSNETTPSYELKIDNEDSIEKGYSGSAVVDKETGYVFAIATDRKTNGQQAYATSAKYLKEIWQEIPEGILISNESTNPYKGLNYFTYEDREHYYGREKESKEIAKALETTKLFTLSGASGSGKSSLIFAGIIPFIESDEVQICTMRPQDKPFKNLASVFIPTLYPDELEGLRKTKELTNDLEIGNIEITELVQHYLDKTNSKKLYLVIDQFEELFTLTKEQKVRNHFLDQLLTLINSELNVTILLSMRADFLSQLSYYEPFNQAYNEHPNTILSLLSKEKLEKVIEQPALSQGVKFQDGLVDRIIDEIENEAGQLPLLEFALDQLWTNKKGRVITHEILDEMKSISHSISHYADKIYNETDDKESIKKVLIKLVNPGSGTEDTRRIASLDEFSKKDRETIVKLANERLIVTQDQNIDIVHEALIREWGQLQEWIEEYREFLEWEKRLREDRKFYEENGSQKEDLLKDSRLLKAEEFLGSHKEYVTAESKLFIQQSIQIEIERKEEQEQERVEKERKELELIGERQKRLQEKIKQERKQRNFLIMFSLLLIGAIIIIGFFWNDANRQKIKAEKQETMVNNTLNQNLVTQAIMLRDNNEILKSKHVFAQAIANMVDINESKNAKFMYRDSPYFLGKLQEYRQFDFLEDIFYVEQKNNKLFIHTNTEIVIWDINKFEKIFFKKKKVISERYNYFKSYSCDSHINDSEKYVLDIRDNITFNDQSNYNITVWDIEKNEEVFSFKRNDLFEVNFIDNNKLLVSSADYDENGVYIQTKVELWDLENRKKLNSNNIKSLKKKNIFISFSESNSSSEHIFQFFGERIDRMYREFPRYHYKDKGYQVDIIPHTSGYMIEVSKEDLSVVSTKLQFARPYFPIIIPDLNITVMTGIGWGTDYYGYDVVIDKFRKKENLSNQDEPLLSYKNEYAVEDMFVSDNKNFIFTKTSNQINVTDTDNFKMIQIDVKSHNLIYLKDNFIAYSFNNTVKVIEITNITEGRYRELLTIENSDIVSYLFFDKKTNELILVGKGFLSKWDIKKAFDSSSFEVDKEIEDESTKVISNVKEDPDCYFKWREGKDLNSSLGQKLGKYMVDIESDKIKISNDIIDYNLKHNLEVNERDHRTFERTYATLSLDGKRLLHWSCFPEVYFGDDCYCKLYLTDLETKTNLIEIGEECIDNATFLKNNAGIHVKYRDKYRENHINYFTHRLYKINYLKLKSNLYPLKTIVDTATEYSLESNELKVLTAKEWNSKKVEYDTLLEKLKK